MSNRTKKIVLARKIFKKCFEKDEDFREGYQANIAMLLHDRYGITGMSERNKAANDIMKVIFAAQVIPKKKKYYQSISSDRFDILDL